MEFIVFRKKINLIFFKFKLDLKKLVMEDIFRARVVQKSAEKVRKRD